MDLTAALRALPSRLLTRRPARDQEWFDAAPCALVIAGANGRIERVNAEARQMFGLDEDPSGGSVDRLLLGGYDGMSAVRRRDARGRRRDGSEFPVELSVGVLDNGRRVIAIRDVTDLTLAAEALVHQANHDPLTGLPNRALFLDRLEHALARARRSQRPLAVIFLDLDDFKLVNDTQGHEAGDALLLELAPRLTAALRPGDTIARFGGDEFVVLCEDLDGEGDAVSIAKRVLAACGTPFEVLDARSTISASAGIAMLDDLERTTVSDLLRDADVAMYRAKARGKGKIELFDAGLRARVMQDMAVESELRRALERDELRLAYQPIVSANDDTIVGAEALLRWQHPRRGLLDADEFIGVALRSGTIIPIGEWVLDESCRQAAAWNALDPHREPIYVSVNIALSQLVREDTVASVALSLQQTGLDPALLRLEITESTLRQSGESGAENLRKLRELGVGIVLDAFGTDLSSLSFLKHLDIDGLKIHRSMIERIEEVSEDDAMVTAVLGLAEALDVPVVAEGVETHTQLERLRAHGCGFVQGVWFARPVSAAHLRRLISERWVAGFAVRTPG